MYESGVTWLRGMIFEGECRFHICRYRNKFAALCAQKPDRRDAEG